MWHILYKCWEDFELKFITHPKKTTKKTHNCFFINKMEIIDYSQSSCSPWREEKCASSTRLYLVHPELNLVPLYQHKNIYDWLHHITNKGMWLCLCD